MKSVELGRQLKLFREARQLSVWDVCRMTGVDGGNLSRIERGEKALNLEVALALCPVYGCTVEDLVRGHWFGYGKVK